MNEYPFKVIENIIKRLDQVIDYSQSEKDREWLVEKNQFLKFNLAIMIPDPNKFYGGMGALQLDQLLKNITALINYIKISGQEDLLKFLEQKYKELNSIFEEINSFELIGTIENEELKKEFLRRKNEADNVICDIETCSGSEFPLGIMVNDAFGYGHHSASLKVLMNFFQLEKDGAIVLPVHIPVYIESPRGDELSIEAGEVTENMEKINHLVKTDFQPRITLVPISTRRKEKYSCYTLKGGEIKFVGKKSGSDFFTEYLFSGGGRVAHERLKLPNHDSLKKIVQLQPFLWDRKDEIRCIVDMETGTELPIGSVTDLIADPSDKKQCELNVKESNTINLLIYNHLENEKKYKYIFDNICELAEHCQRGLEIHWVFRESEAVPEFSYHDNVVLKVYQKIPSHVFESLVKKSDVVIAEGANTIASACNSQKPFILTSESGVRYPFLDPQPPPIILKKATRDIENIGFKPHYHDAFFSPVSQESDHAFFEALHAILVGKNKPLMSYFNALAAHVNSQENPVSVALKTLEILQVDSKPGFVSGV